ncbi:hypothetical protein L0668_20505 [Paraglaciecola aquimarina]|uniref:Uncharacterized protein n=1 Tax=Paraglaciecola algarum TaxID=3050085 RepID=A0ABS9DEQ1_9ALTE|nr:hypothetical protein [Paraglaciecola sp. G1-23]MCF2950498.1 hypothetical protein [Paraglaciecola sp. G1-23]
MDKHSEQCKEVYAYFGLTIYSAQCLEQAMIHLIVFLDHFPKAVPGFSTTEKWEKDFDKFFDGESQRTLGQLLGRLQKLGIPCEELKIKLKEALKKRNWLAHSYFSERAMEFMSEDGRNQMIAELEESAEYFKSVDEEVSSIFYKIAETYGLTEDVFKNIMDDMLVESKSDL